MREGHEWWISDCGSKSGTWLNDSRVTSARRLVPGDFIGIGMTSLKFTPGEINNIHLPFNNHLLETTRPGDSEWLITNGTAVLWADKEGKITFSGPDVPAWLLTFFDDPIHQLPRCLIEWLECNANPRMPYEKRRGDERLRVTACHGEEDRQLLVLSRLQPAFRPDSLISVGLSRAEAALIPWLIRGKRNEEMALILALSPKTVEKHVAKILSKLGVETRTAAAWSIIERTGAHW